METGVILQGFQLARNIKAGFRRSPLKFQVRVQVPGPKPRKEHDFLLLSR